MWKQAKRRLGRYLMEDNIACFVQMVQRRNIRETVVTVILVMLFSYSLLGGLRADLVTAGRLIIGLGAIGILGVIWGALHIPVEEINTHPPARYPDRWRRHMNAQTRWLRFAWLWYVLPLFTGIALTMSGLGERTTTWSITAMLILITVATGVGFLNVQASKQIERNRDAWLGRESTG